MSTQDRIIGCGADPSIPDMNPSDTLTSIRVLVVGDVMLDRYWFGETERISPEAPVPVVQIRRTEVRLGGAANVARNITSLGGHAGLLAVIGDDEAGQTLLTQLSKANIESHTYSDPSLVTTVKVRVIARQQQLLRVDFEDAPNKEVLSEQLDRYGELISKYDLVILSDYGKGGLAHIAKMIEFAKAADRPVLVDPKGDDYSRYAGATIVTPNRAELRAVVGHWTSEADLERRAQQLRDELGLSALLLTRSEEGMTLYSKEGALSVPAHAREVFDVSGAGDTVIAVLAAMLAAGSTLREAVITANRAGGIVVGKLGTSTVTTAELFGGQA